METALLYLRDLKGPPSEAETVEFRRFLFQFGGKEFELRVYELVERLKQTSDQTIVRSPPHYAEMLLTILANPNHAEAVAGCLNERFCHECKDLGPRRAARLYWARAIRSFLPFLKRAIVRGAKWVITLEAVRQFFGG
jgi:hypothetical protein